MSAVDDSIQYYVDRLILQYRGLPKASQTIAILVKQAIGDMLPSQIERAYDLDTAVGVQLDVLAKYIGVSRFIGNPAAFPYFGFVDSVMANPQNPNGFSDSTDPSINANAPFFSDSNPGQLNTALPDDQFRSVLKLKILLNHSDGTLAGINNALYSIYGIPGFIGFGGNASGTAFISGGQVTAYALAFVPTGTSYIVGKGPWVYFTGGGGTGAFGQAIIGFGAGIQGRIVGVAMLSGGSGYTSVPFASFSNTLIRCTDNLDMTLTYDVLPGVPISAANLQTFLPKPMGVSSTVIIH